MKVAEYRDLISELGDVFRSFQSAATSHEIRAEGERLRRKSLELEQARCYTASDRDRQRVRLLLADVGMALAKHREQCDATDAMWTRLAYGAEYR